ncbi:hypothetical protein D3C84_1095720 [compost metagenome]
MNHDLAVGDTEPGAVSFMTQDEARPYAFVHAMAALHAQGTIERRAFIGTAAGDDNFAAGQFDQPLLWRVIQIHRAVGIEFKPGAVR